MGVIINGNAFVQAGGANSQVQYNDNGILGGNEGMTFQESITTLTVNNFVATSTANLGAVGNVTITGGSANYVLTTDGSGSLSWTAGGGGNGISGIAVQEEGTNVVASANTINFVGSGVTASNVGNVATITINSGGGISGITVQDEGSNVVSTATTINFIGAGVNATSVGGVATVNIPGGGGNSSSVSAPYIRTYTGNAIIQCGDLFYWYPVPLDGSSIVNNIGAFDYPNGVTLLLPGTYYFESTLYLNCSGSDSIQGAYACLIENPSISLNPILGTDANNYAPVGNSIAKAGVARIGDWGTTPLQGIGTFTIASNTYVSLAFGQMDSPAARFVGDENNLGYNTTILKLWKTA